MAGARHASAWPQFWQAHCKVASLLHTRHTARQREGQTACRSALRESSGFFLVMNIPTASSWNPVDSDSTPSQSPHHNSVGRSEVTQRFTNLPDHLNATHSHGSIQTTKIRTLWLKPHWLKLSLWFEHSLVSFVGWTWRCCLYPLGGSLVSPLVAANCFLYLETVVLGTTLCQSNGPPSRAVLGLATSKVYWLLLPLTYTQTSPGRDSISFGSMFRQFVPTLLGYRNSWLVPTAVLPWTDALTFLTVKCTICRDVRTSSGILWCSRISII